MNRGQINIYNENKSQEQGKSWTGKLNIYIFMPVTYEKGKSNTNSSYINAN